MKKISFLSGYRVLDDKLYERVYVAISELALNEPELDFMFYYTILTGIIVEKEPFMALCYQAVENFRQVNPDKKITRTLLVKNQTEIEEWREKYKLYFDRCICPAEEKRSRFLTAVTENVDYMICQIYSDILNKTDQKFFQAITEEKRIMVTSVDVEQRIKELISQLPQSTQYIFKKVNEGEHYVNLTQRLQIGPDTIRERHINAIINIQKCLAGQKSYFD